MSLRALVDGGAGELIAHRALKIGLHLCFQLLMVLTLSALCMVSDRGDCCGDRGGDNGVGRRQSASQPRSSRPPADNEDSPQQTSRPGSEPDRVVKSQSAIHPHVKRLTTMSPCQRTDQAILRALPIDFTDLCLQLFQLGLMCRVHLF